MRKIVFSFILFFVVVLAYCASLTIFIDYNKIYAELASTTRIPATDLDKLEYRIEYYPNPTLTIKEIIDEGKIEAENIEIKFSLSSILLFSPKVTSIKLGDVKVHLAHDNVQILSHDEFISELINKNALDIKAKIDRLEFVEADLDIPFIIEDFYFDGLVPDTRFTGKINGVGNIEGKFKYDTNNSVEFNLAISSNEFNAKIIEFYKNTVLESGNVEITSINLANKIGRLIPDLNQFATTFNSTEEVKIKFDINAMNSWLNFNNIIIESDSITGQGNIAMSKNNDDIDKIDLRFSKIDLYSLKKSPSKNSPVTSSFAGGNKIDFGKNKMSTTIVVDQIQLNQNNTLTDVVLLADIDHTKFAIKRFTGNIDKDGKFIVAGEAKQNSFRSLFRGNIAISHSDLNDLAEYIAGPEVRTDKAIPYVFTSEIKLSSVDVSLQNIILNTRDNELNGNVSIKFIGNFPRVSSTLELNSLDMNKNNFPVIKRFYEYATTLTTNTNGDDYLSKLAPLRQLNSMNNINIKINQLLLNDAVYDNFYFNLLLSPGRAKISNLIIKDGDDFLDMDIDLQAQGIKPAVLIKVNDGSMGVDFLSPGNIPAFREKALNDFAIDKFDIVLNIYLSKLYQGDFNLGRVVFLAKTNGKLIEIQNFNTDIFNGRLRSSGSILLEPYTMNFVYALNSAHIAEISKLLPPGYINTGGAISASGMWTTDGKSNEELLYNLYTKSTIITKDITVDNFSYDDLVTKTNQPGYSLISLRSDLKSALLTGKTQIEDLKTDVELSKGLLTLSNMKFKTQYTSGEANAAINIYDFGINLNSTFSFMMALDTTRGRNFVDYVPANIKLKATGNIFSPKKEGEVSEIEEIIRRRKN